MPLSLGSLVYQCLKQARNALSIALTLKMSLIGSIRNAGIPSVRILVMKVWRLGRLPRRFPQVGTCRYLMQQKVGPLQSLHLLTFKGVAIACLHQ